MKLIEVEAVEDRSRAEGGHAVILLRGVERAPTNVTFNLKLVVAEGDEEAETPSAELTHLRAINVTMTADGMALSVGPEIAESTLFVPGAVVEITLPDLGVRGEFLWPAITPLARPKRRNIMIRRNVGDPLLRPVTPSVPRQAASEPGASFTEVRAAETDLRVAALAAASTVKAVEAEPAPAIAHETTIDPSRPVAAGRSVVPPEDQPRTAARRPVLLSSAVPRRPVAEPDSVRDEGLSAMTAEKPRGQGNEPPAAAPVGPPREVQTTPARETYGAEAPVLADQTEKPPHPPGQSNAATPSWPVPAATSGGPGRTISTGSAMALAVATLVAGQVIALRALNLSVVQKPAPSPAAPTSAAAMAPPKAEPAPPPPPQPVHAPASLPQRSVYEVISAGPRSPRGVAAADVSLAKALQLAHALLHGSQAERDPEEAAYWLKHYLAGASGGDSVRIALTQLGSAYAQPVRGERDFTSARIVWELSSGLGDPVAMCFIGALHEHGLGVPQSSWSATAWYDRASVLGRSCAAVQPGSGPQTR